MIIIGLGSNLPGPGGESPSQILDAALDELAERGVEIIERSAWYETEPVPPSDQPNFANGVVLVRTELSPQNLMDVLLQIEAGFGRQRRTRWEARTLDLDIIDFEGLILPDVEGWHAAEEVETSELVLPHPRMHERRFVLQPLAEILPGWTHPVLVSGVQQLLERTA